MNHKKLEERNVNYEKLEENDNNMNPIKIYSLLYINEC